MGHQSLSIIQRLFPTFKVPFLYQRFHHINIFRNDMYRSIILPSYSLPIPLCVVLTLAGQQIHTHTPCSSRLLGSGDPHTQCRSRIGGCPIAAPSCGREGCAGERGGGKSGRLCKYLPSQLNTLYPHNKSYRTPYQTL